MLAIALQIALQGAAMTGLANVVACAHGGATQTAGPLQYTEEARKAYDAAMIPFQERDWEEAGPLFKELKRKYPYSRYARLAELRLADIDFQTDKVVESIQEYRTFVREHRTDTEIPYARYRICKGLFDQISDTIMLSAQEERDQATVIEAQKELGSLVQDYPRGRYAAEVAYMLRTTTGRLVRHELYVARYYLRKGNFEAAISRINYAIKTFDDSGLEAEATLLLGETLLKMHKPTDARTAFRDILTRYPTSPFAVAANQFMSELSSPDHKRDDQQVSR